MPRPRPLVPLSSVVAAVVVAAVVVATQAGDARPGAHVAAAAVTEPTAHPRTASATDPALTSAVQSAMTRSTAGSYGVVIDIDGVGRVVDVNGSTGLLPASTEKLFTTLPLLLNHAQDRFVTTIAATRAPANGVVHGDLVVSVSGDPQLRPGDVSNLARQVRAHGVRRVTGRLVLSFNGLSTARTRTGWKSSYVPWDVGPLSPFAVGSDVWTTTNWAVTHPSWANLLFLRKRLAATGVRVLGADAVATSASGSTRLATRTSDPVGAIVRHTLRWSDNFAAEQMLTVQGWTPINAVTGAAGAGGVATDGSGLSLRDRRTAADEVALLEYAHASSAAAVLQWSLPRACVSGTLRHDMCNTIAAGNVFAKTGTLDHVKALAGYTTDAKGRWVTFAILTNGDVSTDNAMTAMEHVILQIRRYSGS